MNDPVENYYFRTETNQRSNNEDSLDRFVLDVAGSPPITVLSLADGMGGYAHGKDVSWAGLRQFQLTLRAKLQAIETEPPLTVEKLQEALLVALQQANTHIRQMVIANNWHQAGSTIVAAAIWQNRLIATNLGDSPLFHYEAATGKLSKVTLDHSVTGILAQAGIITEEMARHHERRGQLEYYLGGDRLPNPLPTYNRELQSGDLVLLCSDGVNGLLCLAEIQQILASTDRNLEQKAAALISAARTAGEADNQTLIFWCHRECSISQRERRELPITQQYAPEHKLPLPAQDLITIDSTSPRGREIDRQVSNTPAQTDRLVLKPLAARIAIWSICGSVITVAAVAFGGWDNGLGRIVEGWLNGSPPAAPKQPAVPKPPKVPHKLDPEREPIDIIERVRVR